MLGDPQETTNGRVRRLSAEVDRNRSIMLLVRAGKSQPYELYAVICSASEALPGSFLMWSDMKWHYNVEQIANH